MPVITFAGENLIAQQQQAGQNLIIDQIVFANINGLDDTLTPDRGESLPSAENIQLTSPITKDGMLTSNTVVYSTVLSSTQGTFDFNWMGLYSSAHNVLVAVAYVPVQSKIATLGPVIGNVITKNFAIEFNGAADVTGINISAESWQIDYTARLMSMDKIQRDMSKNIYGQSTFLNDAFKIKHDGAKYLLTSGQAILGGLGLEIFQDLEVTPGALPQTVWLDVYQERSMVGVLNKFDVVFNDGTLKNDYTIGGVEHSLVILGVINSSVDIVDARQIISSDFSGMSRGGGTFSGDVNFAPGKKVDGEIYDGGHRVWHPGNLTPLKAHKNIEDAKNDESLILGQQVETSCLKVPGFGSGDYMVVAGDVGVVDGGLYHQMSNGLRLELIHHGRVSVDQFGAVPYDVDFSVWPSAGMGFVDSTVSINAALDTGLQVDFSKGTYRATDELLFTHANQIVRGKGAGALQLNFFARKQGTSWNTRILFHGSPEKYTKTRRQNRLSASDPQDAPTASAINIEAEYLDFKGVLVDLECDYDNLDPYNLGADFDHGVFSGTWTGVNLENIHVRGYFRQASFYLDNTRLGDEHPFVTPGGVVYPIGNGVNNGTDKFSGKDLIAAGGHKGLFIAGPKDGRPDFYYDEIAGGLVPDSRGGYGTSDYLFSQCFIGGPDHHSGVRRYDPPLNDAGTKLDPQKVDIDLAAGSYFYDSLPSRQSRRVKFDTTRFTTIEPIRIFVGNGLEMIFENPVTESLSGTVYATDGVTVIDQYDYTFQSFKDIACYATDYMGEATGARRVDFLQSGGIPNPTYFQNQVTEHRLTIVGNDSNSKFYEYECGWLHVDDDQSLNQDIKVKAVTKSGFSQVQVVADFSGLDITDLSVATIAVKTGESMKLGDNGVLRIDQALSTALPYLDTSVESGPKILADDVYEFRVEGQESSSTRFQLFKNGIRLRYKDGMLSAGKIVACGLVSESGLTV